MTPHFQSNTNGIFGDFSIAFALVEENIARRPFSYLGANEERAKNRSSKYPGTLENIRPRSDEFADAAYALCGQRPDWQEN